MCPCSLLRIMFACMGFPDGSHGNPTVQETRVQSLGQEDALGKGMATHSSILAWRIPWTKECGGLQPMGVAKNWTWLSNFHFFPFPVSSITF